MHLLIVFYNDICAVHYSKTAERGRANEFSNVLTLR